MMIPKSSKDPTEKSFTLFETVIAVGIMSVVMVQMAGLQGNIVSMSEYGVQSAKAMGLARRVMAQVEYYAARKPFSEMKYDALSEIPFEDQKEFSYKLTIKDWKLPLLDFFQGGGGGGEDEEGEESSETEEAGAAGGAAGAAGSLKDVLGDELLKVAKVEVLWPEGARRNSVTLTYLLTNYEKLDENLVRVKSTYDKLLSGKKTKPKPNKPNATVPVPSP